MALLQVQALIVAIVAGLLSFFLGHHDRTAPAAAAVVPSSTLHVRGPVHAQRPQNDKALRLRDGYFEFALVLAVAQLAASMSSAVQGSFVCALVVVSRRFGLDPDNTVVPLAGSLGDLITLTLLGMLSSGLLRFEGTGLATFLFIGLVLMCIVFALFTLRNAYVHELLGYGWVPLFAAAGISSMAGVLLEHNALRFEGYALLAPIVAGIPGITAAVHTSRLSSALHARRFVARTRPTNGADYIPLDGREDLPSAPPPATTFRQQCLESIRPQVHEWSTPITLLLNAVVLQWLFFVFLRVTGVLTFGWLFGLGLAIMSISLAMFALFFSHMLCLFLWYWDYDPDTSCMPFMTALVDVGAQLLLYTTYVVAQGLGDTIR